MNNTSKENKVCAVIPFFNEVNTIEEIVQRTLNYVDCVIAVDDGSTDGSAEKLSNLNDVILISIKNNSGKGTALNAGFIESIKKKFSSVVTIDADLQHDPQYIPDLIKKLEDFDIVIGNRLGNLSSMPIQRIASNKLTSFFLSLKTGQKLLDTQCGFRAFKTKILNDILPKSPGFEAESEILINAARNHCKIGFVSIPTIYGNEKSKMKSFQAISGFIKVLLS